MLDRDGVVRWLYDYIKSDKFQLSERDLKLVAKQLTVDEKRELDYQADVWWENASEEFERAQVRTIFLNALFRK
jgi:hypothetical protein